MDKNKISILNKELNGEIRNDLLHKKLYATDASVYKKYPIAVAFPKTNSDIEKIISFCLKEKLSIIPRAAGTSLAGQCVGPGIVIDVSKYLNKIISIDKINKTVTVQPGVIRDELNLFLKKYGLFFGPNTSTSNYCMIGGMVGNNSSGTTSIKYGVTRDKVINLCTILSDGSKAKFGSLNNSEIEKKLELKSLEGDIYRYFIKKFNDKKTQRIINDGYPDKSIHRRNTGYALDSIVNQKPFNKNGDNLNLSKILCGSEGTLAFTTEITLKLDPLPPSKGIMLALHFDSIQKSMESVEYLMKFDLDTCELIDKTILDCTLHNPLHKKNRFFISGDPKAILLLEFKNDDINYIEEQIKLIKNNQLIKKLSYSHVVLKEKEIDAALSLRHAGLGLLGNMIGDKKAVACIEDTAVPLNLLSNYISDFQKLMKEFNQEIVYYAHAGAGELHLRPVLNLKSSRGVSDFRKISSSVADLVKNYKGSLSGEHGDGIVRSEFISRVIGEENYRFLKEIKQIFDPESIFNPGKIVNPIPMDENLRYEKDRKEPKIETTFDFSSDKGILRASEKCNGAGNCRSISLKGTLCPSYRATRDELHNTRGRANVLREVLTNNKNKNKFDSKELKDAMDLCLSCKACATECPSSVDISLYKAEFQHNYNKIYGSSLRDKIFAYTGKINKLIQPYRAVYNYLFSNKLIGFLLKKGLKISSKRSIPKLEKSLYKNLKTKKIENEIKSVYLYLDEFTNYIETDIGTDCIYLLEKLGYKVNILQPTESGRTYISKGFLDNAKKCAKYNVDLYSDLINENTPLLGIEPSAIYTFNDEYPKLYNDKEKATNLAKNCFLIDTFLANEIKKGNIKSSSFHEIPKKIKIHGNCYQKALGSIVDTFNILNLPVNYDVTILNTGCCGMAGSFGFEKEHYEISQKIAEERLYPSIKNLGSNELLAANGTSCRHQIYDGTKIKSLHPISILKSALK